MCYVYLLQSQSPIWCSSTSTFQASLNRSISVTSTGGCQCRERCCFECCRGGTVQVRTKFLYTFSCKAPSVFKCILFSNLDHHLFSNSFCFQFAHCQIYSQCRMSEIEKNPLKWGVKSLARSIFSLSIFLNLSIYAIWVFPCVKTKKAHLAKPVTQMSEHISDRICEKGNWSMKITCRISL